MAAPLTPGLSPSEIAFVCEMEQVTVIPRQRLEGLSLLGGSTTPLIPPHSANLPLWLALLLKRQRRANIQPPPWLSIPSLNEILSHETSFESFSAPPSHNLRSTATQPYSSPPFLETCTYNSSLDALPYHWISVSHLLLEHAADDIPDAEAVKRLLRDVREVRAAKLRNKVGSLEGTKQVEVKGVAGLEIAEMGGFVKGVIDGLRSVGASKEASRREKEQEERERREEEGDDSDEDML